MIRLWILLLVFSAFADTTTVDTVDTVKTIHLDIKHSLNFRDPKDDSNKVDWHVAAGFGVLFDSLLSLKVSVEGSRERDNGVLYYAHKELLGFRYGYLQYQRDTEDDIKLLNVSAFYAFWDILRVGADVHWDHWEEDYGAYIGIQWKFIFTEVVFWDKIKRIRASFTPSVKLGKRKLFEIGIKANCLYLEDVLDWNAGYLVKFNVDF